MQRLDRNLEEITGELRVVVTGVQVLLVTTKLFGAAAGAITTGLVAIPFVLLWFAAPLYRRAARERE
jgi:hypothetical protein